MDRDRIRRTGPEGQEKIRAVIFDCDGVMFDSRQANIHFYNHLLSRFALPPMTEDKVPFVHMRTAEESVHHLFQGTPFGEEAQQYRKQMDYSPFIRDMVMEPGLKELLARLKPGYGLAVATNRSNTIGPVLEVFGLKEFFDIVVSSLDVEHPKPHPESLLKIVKFFGIRPAQALYVGDSSVDYETALQAGVPFVAYKNGDLDALVHVQSLMDILEVIESLPNL